MIVAVGVGLLAAATAPPGHGQQYGRDQSVVDWINRHAVALGNGDSLAQWFDVIVHRQQVTPARPAGEPRRR
jgi:hypothetical protein